MSCHEQASDVILLWKKQLMCSIKSKVLRGRSKFMGIRDREIGKFHRKISNGPVVFRPITEVITPCREAQINHGPVVFKSDKLDDDPVLNGKN